MFADYSLLWHVHPKAHFQWTEYDLSFLQSREEYTGRYGTGFLGHIRTLAHGGAHALLINTSIILFLTLRRSMLQALGFMFPEIIPFHRWLGVAMMFWVTIHAGSLSLILILRHEFQQQIAFSDKFRGTRNMAGVFAYVCKIYTTG
ncbi:hypothetical protein BGW39_001737 [Mortierella sp. 14UC]|nr:hypothetical protein BGW39_001737 [Mortierella sp. 14UC]